MKGLVVFVLLLLAFAIGVGITYKYFQKTPPVEDATVLLEKIQAVAKFVTVEGQFTEIYNYSEYQGYFTMLYDKKALVRVRATVSAGYDLDNVRFDADAATKTLRIGPLPEPQILSIDHTLDYYDIRQGFFTSFSAEDYNRINQKAKDLIRDQAQKSNLLSAAREQSARIFDIIRFMGENAGWKVEIIESEGYLQQ